MLGSLKLCHNANLYCERGYFKKQQIYNAIFFFLTDIFFKYGYNKIYQFVEDFILKVLETVLELLPLILPGGEHSIESAMDVLPNPSDLVWEDDFGNLENHPSLRSEEVVGGESGETGGLEENVNSELEPEDVVSLDQDIDLDPEDDVYSDDDIAEVNESFQIHVTDLALTEAHETFIGVNEISNQDIENLLEDSPNAGLFEILESDNRAILVRDVIADIDVVGTGDNTPTKASISLPPL